MDTTKPKVTSTTPSNGATEIDKTTKITINFDKGMNTAATAAAASISPGSISSPAWTNSDKTLTFTTTLAENTKYTVTITSAAKDKAGNALDQTPYKFSFTTKGGTPPPPGGIDGMTIGIIIAVVVIVVVLLLVLMLMRKKKQPAPMYPPYAQQQQQGYYDQGQQPPGY